MSNIKKRQSGVARRDILKLFGAAGAAGALPVGGFASADEIMKVAVDKAHNHGAVGYGKGDRLYLEGPFEEGTPEQGYQLPMTPSELIRAGIADVEAYVQGRYKSRFVKWPFLA